MALDTPNVSMGNQQQPDEKPEALSRFERVERIRRRLSLVAHAIVVLALAYYVYGVKSEIDETNAVIEACRYNLTWKCMDEAEAAHRQRE